ncbi:MAG TPA: serine hydrolase [Candidatus Magasanikbacteria bacterium]|nr:serine hydrolase [Candidatus Magasanikbacteria bacterium]
MFSIPFLVKIIVAKIILSLSYGGFLAYQPAIFSEPPQLAQVMVKQQQVENNLPTKNKKTLPLSIDRIKPQPKIKEGVVFSSKLSAQSYAVLDLETEKILLGAEENSPRSIGSISKLMTAIVFLENNPQWDKQIIISKDDGELGKLYLFDGEKISVRDLFFTSLVGSSNNATVALARSGNLNLTDFVKKMNQKALDLGLKNSTFVEPTGLSSENHSTAKEVALILKYALKQDLIKEAVTTKNYEISVIGTNGKNIKRNVINTDILLFNDFANSPIKSILGAKTGFIDEAGYCFTMETQNNHEKKIITVVLGANTHFDRFSEAKLLAEWVYKNYLWPGEEGFEKLSKE